MNFLSNAFPKIVKYKGFKIIFKKAKIHPNFGTQAEAINQILKLMLFVILPRKNQRE